MTFDVHLLVQVLQRYPQPKRWLVGFSGGLDSSVLLHALVACETTIPVVPVHINHGLSPQAPQWQRHCEDVSRALGLTLICEQVRVENHGQGIENAAREARFAVFKQHVRAGDVLLLAHHLDDQVETLLYRLLRGTGPRGLGAMQPWRAFYGGHIGKPLLEFSRQSITAYAETHQLTWIEDDSNQQRAFDRNYLRHEVLPLLQQRWPEFQRRWLQTAALCREADQLNEELAALDLSHCDEQPQRLGCSVDLAVLQQMTPQRRHNLLRYWLRRHGGSVPEFQHMEEIERQLFTGPPAPAATVAWGNNELRHFNNRLYLLPQLPPADSERETAWSLDCDSLVLDDGAHLSFERVVGSGLVVPTSAVTVRRRRGGERCQPQQRAHSQQLKKLFQEYAIEPWLRDHVPLIYVGDALAAVGDLWVCRGFAAPADQPGLVLRWDYPAAELTAGANDS